MQDNKDKIKEKNIANISKHIVDTKIKNKKRVNYKKNIVKIFSTL